MSGVQNIRVIQEFDSTLGKRGVYEFTFKGVTKVVVREGNDIYAIIHLFDKPELMLIQNDVRDEFLYVLEHGS